MKKLIFYVTGPLVGMDDYSAHAFADDASASEISQCWEDVAIDHVQSYGYDFDPEGEPDEYTVSELDGDWFPYDPEKHDGYRAGGGSFEDDFGV